MLGGYANTVAERDRALQTARRVPGVRSVVNQMTMN
jgi:osmotically-inducible protein OsmY